MLEEPQEGQGGGRYVIYNTTFYCWLFSLHFAECLDLRDIQGPLEEIYYSIEIFFFFIEA